MAVVGTTLISGAFAINDITGISAFISGAMINNVSGGSVFTYSSANGMQLYVGVVKTS